MSDPIRIEFLRGLTPEQSDRLMALGRTVVIPPGGPLFQLGEHADRVFLVSRGRVVLTLPIQIRGGQEDVLVEERLSGETLGWSALVPPHRFTLKAMCPVETELLAFDRVSLLDHFAANPDIGYTVIRNVAGVIGHRLGVFQAMWVREMQHVVDLKCS